MGGNIQKIQRTYFGQDKIGISNVIIMSSMVQNTSKTHECARIYAMHISTHDTTSYRSHTTQSGRQGINDIKERYELSYVYKFLSGL